MGNKKDNLIICVCVYVILLLLINSLGHFAKIIYRMTEVRRHWVYFLNILGLKFIFYVDFELRKIM